MAHSYKALFEFHKQHPQPIIFHTLNLMWNPEILQIVVEISWIRVVAITKRVIVQNLVWWWCSLYTGTNTHLSALLQLARTLRYVKNDPVGKHYIIQSRDWLVAITNTSSEVRNSCTSSVRPTAQYSRSNH